jgi:Arc/MetJ-type ribon-helix-helix transcriptional regulator
MDKSISVKRKKRGRPATGVDPLVGIRLPPEMIRQLDELAAAQASNRSEVIRHLLEQALRRKRR